MGGASDYCLWWVGLATVLSVMGGASDCVLSVMGRAVTVLSVVGGASDCTCIVFDGWGQ